jgi:hypothetical protein
MKKFKKKRQKQGLIYCIDRQKIEHMTYVGMPWKLMEPAKNKTHDVSWYFMEADGSW